MLEVLSMLIPVILSGGSGTRLWPLSREGMPKQFLSLLEGPSLFQETLLRLPPEGLEPPMVIANQDHRFRVAEQMQAMQYSQSKIILEPCGRNTAPAIVVAALIACSHPSTQDACLLILPSDHHIKDPHALACAMAHAERHAQAGNVVTFGIVPTYPATGYGYIQAGEALSAEPEKGLKVKAFKEKPDESTAQAFIEAGHYFWNSGMFMVKASTLLEEVERYCPEVLRYARQALMQGCKDLDFIRLDAESFAQCPSISIDYAIMEKTDRAVVVPLDAGWNDVGNWDALWGLSPQDDQGNVSIGDVILHNVKDAMVLSQSALVTLCDVEHILVVQTKDAVLVADRRKAESVKHVVEALKAQQRTERLEHVQVFRPWGSYETIVEAAGFKAKRIIVNPQQKLSLQMHHHRAEHWVVVSGTALVTNGDREFLLSQDESTYIPVGTKHRLENPGKIPLEIIEVQSGAYLEEDDIVRYEDMYQRA
jgi:mannose-1-phosphate guanylyltransferase/mannose-6-phosphate isomerase